MFGFLVHISICLVSAFLMAFYLHMAWALLFAGLLLLGALVFYWWLKKSEAHIETHRANHLALAMACRALNWRGRY